MSLEQTRFTLPALGWAAHFEDAFTSHRAEGLSPARVAREDRERYLVLDETGEHTAEVSGRFRHHAHTATDFPTVGDWVALRKEPDGSAQITALLPRRAAFTRKVPGETTEAQVLAANIDTVFLVTGLDGNFNLHRIERFLAATWDGGGNPVIVLNKADLADDLETRIAEVEAIAFGVPVVAVSALTEDRLASLEPWLTPGATVALLGSSGVGKSTLTNALLGEARLDTGASREADSKGRHTTTRRELVPLPGGALLIDTPGLRELQLWGEESGLDQVFPDLAALTSECRFRDCAHRSEPGCAILLAVEEGRLEAGRVEAWRKMQRELAHLERRRSTRALSEETAKWKQITKSMRQHPKAERWR